MALRILEERENTISYLENNYSALADAVKSYIVASRKKDNSNFYPIYLDIASKNIGLFFDQISRIKVPQTMSSPVDQLCRRIEAGLNDMHERVETRRKRLEKLASGKTKFIRIGILS